MRCYASYIDTGFDAIPRAPQQWRVEKFRHVTQLVKRLNRDDADRPMLSLSAYRGVEIKQYDDENLARTKEEALDYQVVEPGQLVVNPMWVIYGAIGVSQLHGIVSPAYRVYRVSSDLTPRYCDYLLRSHFYVSEYNKYVRGLTTYDRSVRKEDFHEIPVLLPTLEEQNAIVAFLDRKLAEIDRFIAAKQRLIALLQEQRAAIINQAVTRGLAPDAPLKPSGIEWLGDVPAHWDVIRIKYLLESMIDTEHKTAPFYDNGHYLVVRTSNIKAGSLDLTDGKYTDEEGFYEWTRRGIPRPGDVLFTREAPAGEACLVPSDLPLCLGQRVVLMRPNHAVLNPQFCLLSMYGGAAAQYIKLLSQGSTVAHFNMADIANIPILLPPISEQVAITDYVDVENSDIQEATIRAQREIELIKEYRATLISDAVTGKIDVRAEVAEEVRV